MKTHTHGSLFQDSGIIVLSILVAVILVRTDALIDILTATQGNGFIGTFIAGIFFTSVFTTPPAIATLGEIAQTQPIITTALLGALGAVIGDLVIFHFVRDRFAAHLTDAFSSGRRGRIRKLFHRKFFRWSTFLIGGLIIASPFPDELAIGLLGLSKARLSWFIPLSFVFNFAGIYAIGTIARTL